MERLKVGIDNKELMKHIFSIFALGAILLAGISCVETACPVNNAPVIVSITSLPEVHSAMLISDLKSEPSGKMECGFYFGKDRTTLTRMAGRIEGKSIVLTLNDLNAETTYYFKAFVSNGRNEVGSGFESFITEVETMEPDGGEDENGGGTGPSGDGSDNSGDVTGGDDGTGEDNPGGGTESGGGTDDNGGTDDIGGESGGGSGGSGDTDDGNDDGTSGSGSGGTDGSGEEPGGGTGSSGNEGTGEGNDGTGGSSGSEGSPDDGTGESGGGSGSSGGSDDGSGGSGGSGESGGSGGSGDSGGTEEPEPEPEPEPVEFTTEINNLTVDGDEDEICITVTLSGDTSLVKKALIYIGYTADEMLEAECHVKDGKFSLIYYGLEPGVTYFYKASISNGIETKTSETFSFTVPSGT